MPNRAFTLEDFRSQTYDYIERLRDRDGGYGAYRMAPGKRCDLYSSCDIAIMRTIMGEKLAETVSERERGEWCEHINSFGHKREGTYGDSYSHSQLHANGTVVSALSVLGGKQIAPVRLYENFDSPEKLPGWFEGIKWTHAWAESHQFWGGIHCYSMSARRTEAWLDTVFDWLNANVDRETGWWRKGVPHSDRHQGLGGAVHIFPIYEHHGRPFPAAEQVVDSVLAMQLPEGTWLTRAGNTADLNVMHYLELDALYAYVLMAKQIPDYRAGEVRESVRRFGALAVRYFENHARELFQIHPHMMLAAVGVFGLLQQALPEEFVDNRPWTDIFSDIGLYRTAAVERQLP